MNILWIFFLFEIFGQWNFVSAKVVSGPTISHPDNVTEGNHILLKCKASCTNSTCNLTWTSSFWSSSNKSQPLDIVASRTHRNKNFTCTAEDTIDHDVKSKATKFDVFYGPDKVTVAAGSPITVVEGDKSDTKHLACETSGCHPNCQYTWIHNGKTVSNTTKLFTTNTNILRENAGVYKCTASNKKTDINKTSTVTITVKYAPDVTLKWNEKANTLTCEASGNPAVYNFQKIQQKVEGHLVNTFDVKISEKIGILYLGKKDYQDTGKYECFVDNGVKNYKTGNETKSDTAEIKVKDLPVVITPKHSYNVSKGSSLTILISIYSYPKVTKAYIDPNTTYPEITPRTVSVDFYGKSVNIGGQEISLKINETLEEHFTSYTVYIENTFGNIFTNVSIFPEGPPDIPSFSKSDTDADSVTFILVTGFYNGGGQTLVVEHRLEGNQFDWSNETFKYFGVEKDQRVNLVVRDLNPETVYEFRAFAFNEYNRSEYTEIIKVKTNEAPLSGATIAAIVSGTVIPLIIAGVVVAVLLFLRYRRKKRDIDGGTYKEKNEDLTVEMETSPVYENNQLQHGVYTGEPASPQQPSTIYENTRVAIGEDVKGNGETIPPYLDLNNLDAVVEAYLDVDQSKTLVQQSSAKSDLSDGEYVEVSQSKTITKQSNSKLAIKQDEAVSEGFYVEMNVAKDVKESQKRSKEKDSPYVNEQKSQKLQDGSEAKDERDYQNVSKFKKSKNQAKKDKPYKNKKKEVGKGKLEDAEDVKDYQNVNQYKKQPSVESSSELYMEMSAESRQSVTSLPGYQAPPPPLEEEEYMNIRIGKQKR